MFLIQISLKADERDVYDFFSPAGKVSPDLCLELVVPLKEELHNLSFRTTAVRVLLAQRSCDGGACGAVVCACLL